MDFLPTSSMCSPAYRSFGHAPPDSLRWHPSPAAAWPRSLDRRDVPTERRRAGRLPLTYDDLAPYYARVARRIGVSGESDDPGRRHACARWSAGAPAPGPTRASPLRALPKNPCDVRPPPQLPHGRSRVATLSQDLDAVERAAISAAACGEGRLGHSMIETLDAKVVLRGIERELNIAIASDCPTLITGEAGMDKETIARWIHDHSRFGGTSLRIINCANSHELPPETALLDGVSSADDTGTLVIKAMEKLNGRDQDRLFSFARRSQRAAILYFRHAKSLEPANHQCRAHPDRQGQRTRIP